MTENAWLQIWIYLALLALLAKPLGTYMARVYDGRPCGLNLALARVERLVCRLCRIDPKQEMGWKSYAKAMLLFNLVGLLAVYLLQRIQGSIPFNPAHLGPVGPQSALNTAVSFATNTNWQGYAGEVTMSPLTQMAGLTVQNFLSAASGMAVLVALARGIARRGSDTIGNFWADAVRGVLYILLPLSSIVALALVSQGVVQSLAPPREVRLLEPSGKIVTQTILVGPVASQVAIKQVGTNGGGYFNANAAHPFENPTPLSNFIQMLAMTCLGVALCSTFGILVGDPRQGWALLAAMLLLLVPLLLLGVSLEQAGNPLLEHLGVDSGSSALQSGGNMEGKEARFGPVLSAAWAASTTGTSCGAVNSMHDSFTPLGGAILLLLMQLGEVAIGGVGSGLFGLLLFVIVAVFTAGLMVGRTPEYLGKKIGPYEMKMASLAILVMPLVVLVGTAVACARKVGVAGIANPGAHGFTEILYAFSSAGNNNGSAFAGLGANSPFYNLSLALAMLAGRFLIKIPVLAIAGSLARKRFTPPSPGTLPTHTPLFVAWVVAIVLLVGGLTFFPALALGPLAEHLTLFR